jgi:predicted membrane channel-forming protein YqfA (hemolysin III family)
MSEKLKMWKSVILSAFLGGLVYAILMSLFYQFYNEEVFNIKKFFVDFLMIVIIIIAIGWWSRRKKS